MLYFELDYKLITNEDVSQLIIISPPQISRIALFI